MSTKPFATLVLFFLLPFSAQSFDDMREALNVDVLYHYSRIERATLFNTDNFQSRQGAMLQVEYEDQIDLFWRWYAGGDITFANYESTATTSFSPRNQMPWQIYLGTGFQLGDLKSLEVFFGLGASTEAYFVNNGVNSFTFEQAYSARAHLGFSWRFLSISGSSAKLLFRYAMPLTDVDHNGTNLSYRGILDGYIRLRGHYDSSFSFLAGIRFEDYQVSDQSVTYFTSRIYAGIGLHFK